MKNIEEIAKEFKLSREQTDKLRQELVKAMQIEMEKGASLYSLAKLADMPYMSVKRILKKQ